MSKKKKLRGNVEKIIAPVVSSDPEKVQIKVEGAEELYREIRIDNALTDEDGSEVALKEGAQVDVVIEADSNATIKRPQHPKRSQPSGKR